MSKIKEKIGSAARSGADVLILGETGTGKELVANAIHIKSRRRGLFVAESAAGMVTDTLKSLLFGHEEGAFTGAIGARIGLFESANGGTVFLDEIGEAPLEFQAVLLRPLDKEKNTGLRQVERVGGKSAGRKIYVDFQLVCATNRNLAAEVEEGRFREDLFHRINKFEIKMPALRERVEDVPLILHSLSHRKDVTNAMPPRNFTDEAVDYIKQSPICQEPGYGNIRGLQRLVTNLYTSRESDSDVFNINDVRPVVDSIIANKGSEKAAIPLLNPQPNPQAMVNEQIDADASSFYKTVLTHFKKAKESGEATSFENWLLEIECQVCKEVYEKEKTQQKACNELGYTNIKTFASRLGRISG
jgi:DNA-binding NtrC family response regulator